MSDLALMGSPGISARQQIVRQSLFQFFTRVRRGVEDARASTCEILHAKTGTSINTRTITEEDKPPELAIWALEECNAFVSQSGESSPTPFHVLYDGTRACIWVYPENFEGGSAEQALSSQAIAHNEAMMGMMNEMFSTTMKHTADMISALANQNALQSRAVADATEAQMKQMGLYRELVESKEERALNLARIQAEEGRKSLLTDRLIGVADQAAKIGITAVGEKVAQAIGKSSALDQFAALLDPEEKQVLSALVDRAAKRAAGARKLGAGGAAAAPAQPAQATATTEQPPEEKPAPAADDGDAQQAPSPSPDVQESLFD